MSKNILVRNCEISKIFSVCRNICERKSLKRVSNKKTNKILECICRRISKYPKIGTTFVITPDNDKYEIIVVSNSVNSGTTLLTQTHLHTDSYMPSGQRRHSTRYVLITW